MMGVADIPSGTTITEQDIADRHETVRTLLNAMGTESLGPKALGSQHVPSALHLFDVKKVVTTETINTTTIVFSEDPAFIESDWQVLTNYQMTNGGAGYTLPPCILIAIATLHLVDANPAPDSNNWDAQLWFNLAWTKDGVADISQLESVMYSAEADYANVHKMVTLVKVLDYSGEAAAFSIDDVTIRAITQAGGTAPFAAPDFTVENGVLILAALYRQS